MTTRPRDTGAKAWEQQQEILARIGPEARFRIAIQMSDAIRTIQVAGARDRNPAASREDILRELVARQYGEELPRRH